MHTVGGATRHRCEPGEGNNNVRIDRYSAVIHLEAISSIVLPN
jgi:hypothetical protein